MIPLVKLELKPFYEKKKNANFEKHGGQNLVAVVTSMLTFTSR